MATVPTFTTGALVSKSDLDFLLAPPNCRVYHNAAQSISTGTVTTLAFNSERWDTDTMHDTVTNNSRIVFTTAGRYLIGAHIEFDSNATGVRLVWIRLNGSTYIATQYFDANSAAAHKVSIATYYNVAAASYAEVQVFQNSGGNLNVATDANESPEFWAVWVGA